MNQYYSKKITDGIRRKSSEAPAPPVAALKKIPEEAAEGGELDLSPGEPPKDHLTFIEKLARKESEEQALIIEPAVTKEEESEIKVEEPYWIEEKEPGGSRRFVLWGLAGGAVLLLLLAVVASTVFARVTVTLKPLTESVTLQELAILFDTNLAESEPSQKAVPAELLEFSRNLAEEFESSGRELIQEKARGKVKVYNRFSSSPQTLVASTRFLTDSGILFRLPKTITVPGAKIEEGKIVPNFLEAELVADKSGEGSDISGEVTLKIPGLKGTSKYEGFFAVASGGFSGGFEGEARVVSEGDLKKAEEQVTKKIFEELRQEIVRKIPPDFKALEALREIEVTGLDAPPKNVRRDRFSVEAKALGKILIFREKDVVNLVKVIILQNDDTVEFIDGSANLEYLARNVNFGKGSAEVTLQGSAKTRAVINKAEIAELIKGQKEGSIVENLKGRSELASFNVAFFPPWIFRAPQDPAKIRLIVDER